MSERRWRIAASTASRNSALRPGAAGRAPGLDTGRTALDLLGPRGLDVVVRLSVQAGQKCSRKLGALRQGKPQGGIQDFVRLHVMEDTMPPCTSTDWCRGVGTELGE